MKPKLMFVVNLDKFFMSHRLQIAQAALQHGFEVHVVTGLTSYMDKMRALGLIVHPLSLDRRSVGILSNGRTFFQILRVFMQVKPDVVHLVTIKPVLLGGFAARLAGVHGVVAAISGLGFVFTSYGIKARFRRWLVEGLYRLALGHNTLKVIFQNEDDRASLVKLSGLSRKKTTLISGSGVDLDEYPVSPLPKSTPIVILAARLLIDKGVREFVEAAHLLKDHRSNARFVLVGNPDTGNPATITEDELSGWLSKGVIEHWGYHDDMPHVLSLSHIVVLPSYREGLPKILIEAAACGRPVITTNVPGCRDAIKENKTGLLVPLRDAEALAKAINRLLVDRNLCEEMGRAGRELAEQAFNVKHVVKQHLHIYNELLQKVS